LTLLYLKLKEPLGVVRDGFVDGGEVVEDEVLLHLLLFFNRCLITEIVNMVPSIENLFTRQRVSFRLHYVFPELTYLFVLI